MADLNPSDEPDDSTEIRTRSPVKRSWARKATATRVLLTLAVAVMAIAALVIWFVVATSTEHVLD